VVGTAGSISTLDFLGATVSVIANTGAAGIATVTIATEQKQDIQTLNVSGVSTFAGNTNITGDIVSDLTILSTDAGSSAGPIINLYRNSATPADADYLGQIKFQGESDTGVQRNYAKITGKILDASNTAEDGILEFAFLKAGSNNISGRFRSDSLQLLNGTSLTVAGTAEVDGNITANGDIIGDGATNISGMNNVTATNFNSTSDARLKTNVQTITSPLEKLNQIDGVSFDWVT
ncbi:MAG: tail fiber domain-containing protein, partial [Pseudomonadota bacterium]|nr:tail fiber domain-containing protein [Pseudomonadota bacterium]